MRSFTADQLAVIKQRIRATCHALQALFVFDIARRISLLCGRGAGKTAAELMRMVLAMASRDYANCIYIASTRESAERLAWKDLKRIVSTLRLAGVKFNESKLTCTFPNGSSLLLFGADAIDDVEKLRGITWHEVAIDEVASIKRELLRYLLDEVIGPRCVGAIVLLGTPGKILEGLFYQATAPGVVDPDGIPYSRPYKDRDLPEYADWNRWSAHGWSIEDGIEAGIKAMIEIGAAQLTLKASNGWSDRHPAWLRERKAMWVADGSTHVYQYKPRNEDGTQKNEWTPKGRTPFGFAMLPTHASDWAYGIGMDVGFSDAFAIEVFAFSYTHPSRKLWHVYEVYTNRCNARDIAKLLIGDDLNHNRYGGIFGQIGWPDVLVGDFDGKGGWLLKELGEVYSIVVKPAEKPYKYKDNAIEIFNGELIDDRIYIMEGSHLASEMMGLQWVVDQYGKRAENKAQPNHACDAAMYLRNELVSLLPSATGEDTPPSLEHLKKQQTSRDPDDRIEPSSPPEYGDQDAMYAPGDW